MLGSHKFCHCYECAMITLFINQKCISHIILYMYKMGCPLVKESSKHFVLGVKTCVLDQMNLRYEQKILMSI